MKPDSEIHVEGLLDQAFFGALDLSYLETSPGDAARARRAFSSCYGETVGLEISLDWLKRRFAAHPKFDQLPEILGIFCRYLDHMGRTYIRDSGRTPGI